jgi:hypothetical protein
MMLMPQGAGLAAFDLGSAGVSEDRFRLEPVVAEEVDHRKIARRCRKMTTRMER